MGSNVYSLVNAILFGLVMVEVSFQICFSFINKQKLSR